MNQLSFEQVEKTNEEIIKEMLIKEINNPEYSKYLSVEMKKDGLISISAKSFLAARVKLGKKAKYLTIREANKSYFEKYLLSRGEEVSEYINEEGNSLWVRLPIKSLFDVLTMAEPICAVYMTVLADFGGERFGCCSRYEQCSDAKKCIHPDFILSRACSYRKNLENGKIFYGKNRNI